jgi:WD repeat and SOF domain-containing protein 1
MLSGACDGEVRLWDLATQECIHTADLHHGFVQGLCTTPSGDHFISVGQDKTIRVARLDDEHIAAPADEKEEAITLVSKNFFTGVDHHRKQDLFATSGPVVDLWSTARSEPITSFSWGADTVTTVKVPFHCTAPACLRTIRRSNVRPSLVLLAGDVYPHPPAYLTMNAFLNPNPTPIQFNPVEVNVLATAADDRNIALYDARAATPIRKIILAMRTNAICWNPMEAFNFTVANEDHNLYTFDMRKLKSALNVHKDHVSAVLDVDYSPTGREFVSGSYVPPS